MTEGLDLHLHADAEAQLPLEDRLPVAQYVRMSTEHQKYSTDNQAQVIAAYAELHKMRVVRTYMDAGKSGLNLRGRPGLQQLLQDVSQPHPGFAAVLVYDISRWGRFPDPDEAAVYELTCKRRGIRIVYCAEQFKNDGSLSSTVMVGLKRSMAAEYSRELSVKVFAGQRNLVQRGYRQGGTAGYGLRRQLVDEHHNVKGVLARGEQKSIQTDRVLLVPGPADEVATVQEIYRLFLDERLPEAAIARALNRQGLTNDHGRPWADGTVHEVLTNEKYIGNNVFNRKSFKLQMEHRRNPPTEWIRKDGAFEALVQPARFRQVQALIAERASRLDDNAMLDQLRAVLHRHGTLSETLLDEEPSVPSSACYRKRFGSLIQAYALVGYRPKRDITYLEVNKALRRYHPEVLALVVNGIAAAGGQARVAAGTDLITVNDEFTVSVVIGRCKAIAPAKHRWRLRLDAGLRPDCTIVTRMAPTNQEPLDYFVLPALDCEAAQLPVRELNSRALDCYRVTSLDTFFALCGRQAYVEVV